MWAIVVLCGVIATYGVRGSERYQTTAVQASHGYPSCRYNCGSHMGYCSCSSSCVHNGNCCYDYHYYCPSTTEGPRTTGYASCRYNCGSHMGHCSCSSSCVRYGNCCYDYHSYCSSTTQHPTRTTGYASCRYNCGSHMGHCSCSSSCVHYGNCCYDYYSYCSSTTQYPIRTTGYASCRYNCGWNMGHCSCSSSCERYGNCCYDYYSYCSSTTQHPIRTTVGHCGGSLLQSGTFSSPNHPSYYHDNAYCVWQLRTTHDQRILLSFTFMELENCCSCDYISVYNGPSVNSQYLGKVCNSSLNTFNSTSNYMTVVFRSDSSVVARGFKAEFQSTLSPSAGRVDCSSDGMRIVIERSYLNSLGFAAHNLYLDDPNCRPQVSSYQVVFNYPLNSCGNVRKFDSGRAKYSNTIRAYTSTNGEITYQSHFKLNVSCWMDQDSTSQIMYLVQSGHNSSLIGTGRFNTSIRFYTSSSYQYPIFDSPYIVTLSQYIYVEVRQQVYDNSLNLFLDTCVASPSPTDFQTRRHYLIRKGCVMDNTVYVYNSGFYHAARFRFKAFQFMRATDAVYIQCKVVVCENGDRNSRCYRGCLSRRTRDLGSEHGRQTLVLGPIHLKDPEKNEEGTQDKE